MDVTSASILNIERRDEPSKHYVYVILVELTNGSRHYIFRRYSDFFDLQINLIEAFPEAAGKNEERGSRVLPFIPGKILFGRSQIREVALERQPQLNNYLAVLLLMKGEIASCSFVKKFLQATPEDVAAASKKQFSNRRHSAEDILISEPLAMPRANVIRDHSKSNPKEVTVKVGQVVEVLERASNGWTQVRADLQWGWMPTICLEFEAGSALPPVKPPEEIDGMFVVVKAITEPALALGSLVTVAEVREDGWWRIMSCSEPVPAVCLRSLRPDLHDLLLSRKPGALHPPLRRTNSRSLDTSPQRHSAPQPQVRSQSPYGRKLPPPRPPMSVSRSPINRSPRSSTPPPPPPKKPPSKPAAVPSSQKNAISSPSQPTHSTVRDMLKLFENDNR